VECEDSCGNIKNGSPTARGIIFLVRKTARECWSVSDGLL